MAKKTRFDYFDSFSRQIRYAQDESSRLIELLQDYQIQEDGWMHGQVDAMHQLENDADEVTHAILAQLAVEFMPPIDREDVSELAQLLDDVVDSIDEIVQHLYMYNLSLIHPDAVRMAQMLDESVRALVDAVDVFRDFKKPKKLAKLLSVVHDKESEADDIYMEAKRDLFLHHTDTPVYLLGWSSMFSHMEEACDRCEKAASVMSTIALKNS